MGNSEWSPTGGNGGSISYVPVPSGDTTGATDTAAIEAVLSTATGVVVLSPGTYYVSMQDVPGYAGYHACVLLRSGQILRGAGRGKTIIKLAAGQTFVGTDHWSIVENANLNGGDTITVEHLTIDGNAANYSGTNYTTGLRFQKVTSGLVYAVSVINVYGTATSGAGETFHYEANSCNDVHYISCRAIGSAGSTASGFSADSSQNITYTSCVARGMTVTNGFTHWTCAHIHHVNCISQLNGSHGFNSELSRDIAYANCLGGGQATTSTYPYTDNQSLGNTGSGFVCNGTIEATYDGCHAVDNATDGFVGATDTGIVSQATLAGCRSWGNRYGVNLTTDADTAAWKISRDTDLTGNVTNDARFGTTIGAIAASGVLTAPGVGSTGVFVANPYPFEVMVYTIGGTITGTTLDGAAGGSTGGTSIGGKSAFVVKQGGTAALTYTGSPSWVWYRAG